ncbi:MAG: hypothetical protein Q9208_007510 [Pyrenodesmia sp. 3 TL-2023]
MLLNTTLSLKKFTAHIQASAIQHHLLIMNPTQKLFGYIQRFTIAHNHYARKPQVVPMVKDVCTEYIEQRKDYKDRNAAEIVLISSHHVDETKPKEKQFWYWTVRLLNVFGGVVTTTHVPQPTSEEWVAKFKEALASRGALTGGMGGEMKDDAGKTVGEGGNNL